MTNNNSLGILVAYADQHPGEREAVPEFWALSVGMTECADGCQLPTSSANFGPWPGRRRRTGYDIFALSVTYKR